MWDWIEKTFDTLAGYFIDLLVWLLEFVFWIFDSISRFLWGLVQSLVDAMFDAAKDKMPEGIIDTITASYAWLQYVNEWVPIEYGITLFVAYYAIAGILYVFRFLISLIPFVDVKV